MPLKICVYAICKNEEKFVDRWMASMREADQVVVVDTGSTDATVDMLRARGAMVYVDVLAPFRFDVARNIALSYVPGDADLCVSTDLDELFEPGWRAKLEEAWRPEYTRASYPYVWRSAPESEEVRYERQKIHIRRGYRWVHPVHEDLKYDGVERLVRLPNVVLHHYPDPSKSRTQYLPLLELSAAEDPSDDRTAFWLGREYYYTGRYDEAITTLTRYLALPSALWIEERSAGMRFIALAHRARGESAMTKQWLFRAIAECPEAREPLVEMAKLGYAEGDWPLSWVMAELALRITQPSGSYLNEPESWGAAPYDYAAIALYQLGLTARALERARQALAEAPNDVRIQQNLRAIEAAATKGSDAP